MIKNNSLFQFSSLHAVASKLNNRFSFKEKDNNGRDELNSRLVNDNIRNLIPGTTIDGSNDDLGKVGTTTTGSLTKILNQSASSIVNNKLESKYSTILFNNNKSSIGKSISNETNKSFLTIINRGARISGSNDHARSNQGNEGKMSLIEKLLVHKRESIFQMMVLDGGKGYIKEELRTVVSGAFKDVENDSRLKAIPVREKLTESDLMKVLNAGKKDGVSAPVYNITQNFGDIVIQSANVEMGAHQLKGKLEDILRKVRDSIH